MNSTTAPAPLRRDSLLGATAGPLRLRLRGGLRHGQTVRLNAAKLTIGSAPNCGLRLVADGIRPLHCWVLRGAAGTLVRCLDGDTRINGGAFTEARLEPGDRLGVGPIEFEVLGEAAPAGIDPIRQRIDLGPPPSAPPVPAVAWAAVAVRQSYAARARRLLEEIRRARKQQEALEESLASERAQRLEIEHQLRTAKSATAITLQADPVWESAQQATEERARVAEANAEQERSQRQRAEDQIAEHGERLSALQQELRERIDEFQRQEDHWREQVAELRAEHAATKEQADAVVETRLSEIEIELTRARKQIADQSRSLQEWNQRSTALQDRESRLEEQAERLATQLEQQDARRRELDALAANLAAREAELSQAAESPAAEFEPPKHLTAESLAEISESPIEKPPIDGSPVGELPVEEQEADAATEPDSAADRPSPQEPSPLAAVLAKYGYEVESGDSKESLLPNLAAALGEDDEEEFEEEADGEAWEPVAPAAEATEPAVDHDAVAEQPMRTKVRDVDDEEESIEDYMQRLLHRVRGESDSPASKEQPVVKTSPTVAREQAPTPAESEEIKSQGPYVPRAAAPERAATLQAMREVANESRRSALDQHDRSQTQLLRYMKLGTAVAGYACGVGLYLFVGFSDLLSTIGIMCGLGIGLSWTWQYIQMQREIDEPTAHAALVEQPADSDLPPTV